ncbi:hypothetical protein ATCC90586_000962 [Pythium insidiosum]|nr:hypothetical protein ATCC90586_000962 [Pythium insidiosum]
MSSAYSAHPSGGHVLYDPPAPHSQLSRRHHSSGSGSAGYTSTDDLHSVHSAHAVPIGSPLETRYYQELPPASTTSHSAPSTGKPAPAFDVLDVKNPMIVNQCTLSWQNVSYVVTPKRALCGRSHSRGPAAGSKEAAALAVGERRILKNITGRSAPGELTAIIGPSGAGKTTLLDILADRVDPSGRVEGVVEVNGRPRSPRLFRAMMNYVAQEMSFLGSFTVLETLQMAAGLSLPNHIPRVTREMRVQDVIEDMGLRNCARTRVGDIFHKGISNGQRKRLSIAVELLSNPSMLLLDEPTSGLDSSSAQRVMEHIVKLCKEGKNVVTTIHQPSSAIYEMFSNVMILSMGEMVFFGPTSATLPHFFSMGYVCPMYSNPAEYFCQLVNKDFHDQLKIEPFVAAYEHSNEANRLKLAIAADRTRPDTTNNEILRVLTPSGWNQFLVLLKRNWLNNLRNPGVFWIRVFMYVMLSLMVGTMYLSSNDEIKTSAIVPLLFYVQAFLVFMSVAALPSFIEQRAVFQREQMNNSLHLLSFTMANFLAAIPGIAFISVVSTAIVVYFAGVHSFGSFFLNLFLSLVVAESFMHVIGAAVPHYIIGIALGAGMFGMFMLCEGFMVPFHSMPSYWLWGYYLAFHTYSFESFMYEHFSKVDTAEAWALLKDYGMEHVDVTQNMLILVAYAVVLQILFVFVLYFFHTGRRH